MNRSGLFLVIAATAISFPALAAREEPAAAREEQWVFRKHLGDGSESPTAIFLAENYSAVLFRATCDPARHELVLEYFGDGERPLVAGQRIVMRRGNSVKFVTRLVEHHLEGRSKLTPQLMGVLTGAGDLEIEAPNIADEPWYVGRASALAQLAKTCR